LRTADQGNNNLLLTEREGRSGEYWPEVMQYKLISSLLYGTRAMLVSNLPAFENTKYTVNDRFHGNGVYGKILTKKEPIRKVGFALPYNNAG